MLLKCFSSGHYIVIKQIVIWNLIINAVSNQLPGKKVTKTGWKIKHKSIVRRNDSVLWSLGWKAAENQEKTIRMVSLLRDDNIMLSSIF